MHLVEFLHGWCIHVAGFSLSTKLYAAVGALIFGRNFRGWLPD